MKTGKDRQLKKRTDYLSWDEYFMGVALLSAMRSKDPNTQVGACIVNPKNKIVGVGYNGLPTGCPDDEFPWDREGDFLDTKYPYICHAELNAVINKISADLYDCRLYVALFPCNECAKVIIQAGITEVIYLSDKYADTDPVKASRRMFRAAGVNCRQLEVSRQTVTLTFSG
jgi:dCMP deaminase